MRWVLGVTNSHFLNLNILDVSNITVNESALFKSDISLDGGYIYYSSGTLPENTGNILATKQYVDEFIQGIHVKKSVEFATISGENLLFDNIDNNQLTINLSTGYLDSCNNPDIYIVNNRVLVKNQTDETQNGVYYILENASSNLTLERTQDLSAGSKSQGVYVFIDGSNSSQQNTSWIQTNDVSNVIIGILNASQNLTNRAPFMLALISRQPAACLGLLPTIPTVLPFILAKPVIIFLA